MGTVFLADRVEIDLVDFGMTWSNVLDEDATAIVEEAQPGLQRPGLLYVMSGRGGIQDHGNDQDECADELGGQGALRQSIDVGSWKVLMFHRRCLTGFKKSDGRTKQVRDVRSR